MRRVTVLLLAIVLIGCGAPAAPTTAPAEQTQPAQPTPNIEATVQAAVQATVQAVVPAAVKATFAAIPTATPVPATAVPAATATTQPAAKPAAAADVKVEVTQFNHYTNSIGGTVVQGLVENKGTVEAGSIQVAISLIGADGKTVGAGNANPRPSLLKPGVKAVWSTSISKGPDFKDIKVQVQARPADRLAAAFSYLDLKVDDVTVTPARGRDSAKVSGQVTNTGSKAANLVGIAIAIYNPDGTLHFTDTTFAKLDELAPGQSSPFEFSFFGSREITQIDKYELFVEGHPKS
jgi:hypothetical protein